MVVYEHVKNSYGEWSPTDKIVGSYRNYYGPTPYTSRDFFSMNCSQENFQLVKKTFPDFVIENENFFENCDPWNKNFFRVHVNKIKKVISFSLPHELPCFDICFHDDFRKVIEGTAVSPEEYENQESMLDRVCRELS